MVRNPNQKIYQTHIPREYILSKLNKDVYGKIRSTNDAMIISLLNTGKTIGESIILVSHNAALPMYTELFLCRRYLRIIKNYMHEYNLTKKRM